MPMRSRFLVLALLPLAVACGGAPPAKVASAEVATAPTAQEAQSDAKLTPVAAPEDVIALMRVSSLGSLVDTLGRWSNAPFDWRNLLKDVVGNVDGVVLFDAPVDAVAVLDPESATLPKVLYAVSIGVSSVQRARDLFDSKDQLTEQLADGSYSVTLGGTHCLLEAALGAAPARLVCADKARAIDQLSGYMARGLPQQSLSKSAIYAELRAEPWRRRFGRQLQMVKLGVPFVLRELSFDNSEFDAALSDSLYALADEVIALSQDLDVITVEGQLDERAQAFNFSTSIKLRSHSSWFGHWLTQAAGKMGAPPESFWLMPADADGASYQVAASDDDQAVRAGAIKLARGGLSYLGVPARLRDDTLHALDNFLQHPSAGCSARGSAVGDGRAQPTAYRLFAFDDQGRAAELLKQLALVYNHPATRKTISTKLKLNDWASLTVRRAAVGTGLPPQSTVYELTLPENMRDKLRKLDPISSTNSDKLLIAAATVGGRSWVGVSSDEKLLGQKLSQSIAAGASGGLRQNQELGRLAQERALSAGFETLREWLSALSEMLPVQSAALEHGGRTPMFHRWDISQNGNVTTLGISVPKQVFADLSSALMSAASQSFSAALAQ
ncbi:MAG TPA: hypothetical protein VL137_12455 [Polyangiaceae bacterium]|nr:hypothetical protein [Polyangiaceae bacterium]